MVLRMKDYEPQPITLFQTEWEDLMECLDKSSHERAKIIKYKVQCRIDRAVEDGKWI